MGTNPIGRGTENLSVNVPSAMKAALQTLADASGMKLSEYLRRILQRVVEDNVTYRVLTEAQVQAMHDSLVGPPAVKPAPPERERPEVPEKLSARARVAAKRRQPPSE